MPAMWSARVPDAEPHNAAETLVTFSEEWLARRALAGERSEDAHDLPTKCQLARLVEVLFQASLNTEEGRYPRLAAMWMPRRLSR